MIDRNQLLESIKEAASANLITRAELQKAYNDGRVTKKSDAATWDISKTLYFIGAAIIFIGIWVFACQQWDELNNISKVLLTLGTALACYITGVILIHYKKIDLIGQSFYFISMLLMPVGLHVVFDIAGFDIGTYQVQTLISGTLLVCYVLSFIVFKKHLFTIFNIIYGTWFFFALSGYLVRINPYFSGSTFNYYRILFVGISYLLLGFFFSIKNKAVYSRLLYSAGTLGLLSAAFALGGYEPNQNLFWEIIYPGLIFGLIFLGIYLRTRVFLTFSAIYLFAYICKITFEYFKDSVGWSVSLIIVGMFLIAIGYLTIYLHQKLSSISQK
ncbi:MAG: DUF2157 domain-containing protein [Candidatus Omnitrophica bacterium]|nr:DUF2157 domain-containing protein [Candidatus Omnitrophota bacterium]